MRYSLVLLLLCLPLNAFADTLIARLTVRDSGNFTCCPPVLTPPTHFLDSIVLLQPSSGPFLQQWDFPPPKLFPTGYRVTFLEGTFDGEPLIIDPPVNQWLFTSSFMGNTSWNLGNISWRTSTKSAVMLSDTPAGSTLLSVFTPSAPIPNRVENYFLAGAGPRVEVLQVPESSSLVLLFLPTIVLMKRKR
jgi:hypothetical protein